MAVENEEILNTNDTDLQKQEENRRIQETVQARLRHAAKKEEELRLQLEREKEEKERLARELEEARAKVGTAGSVPTNNGQPAPTREQIQAELKQEEKYNKFRETMKEAVTQDKEFAELVQKEGAAIPPEVLTLMSQDDDIKNAPAVIKHLLVNKRSQKLMQDKLIGAIQRGDLSDFREYLYKVSDEVEAKSPKAQPSEFDPPPDFSDVGQSGDDFDSENYIASKY